MQNLTHAASTTNLTPEQLAAAKLILDQEAQSATATAFTSQHHVQNEDVQPTDNKIEVTSIDPDRKKKLETKFIEAIQNPRFWVKKSRYDAVMSALVVPVFDDRSLHQYYIHAESDLNAEAARKSQEAGVPAILPTEEQVKAEAWRRWIDSESESVTKSLNKKRREEARSEGRKFIPVPDAEVQTIVAESEARLRASENG